MEAYKSLSVFEILTRELAAPRSAPIPVRRTHARQGQARGVAKEVGERPGGKLPRLVHAGEDEVVYRLSVPVGGEPDVVLELCAAHLMNLPLLAARKMLDPASLHEMTRLVLQAIWDRNGNIRVDTAAALLGLNPARVRHHFVQDFGRSATNYRKQYMAEIACAMLGVTPLSAREIARILGTKSAEHLAKLIRRFYPDIDLRHERATIQARLVRRQ